jgi:hypothetical protein
MDEAPRPSSCRLHPVKVYGSAARPAAATPAERERVVAAGSASILTERGFFGALGKLFDLWEIVWSGLAISSAWRIAQRASP